MVVFVTANTTTKTTMVDAVVVLPVVASTT
jgi:hypothetical protein